MARMTEIMAGFLRIKIMLTSFFDCAKYRPKNGRIGQKKPEKEVMQGIFL